MQIKVVRSMGIPYSKHRGVAEDAVGVRVDSTTPLGINSLPFMAVRCATCYLPPPKPQTELALPCMNVGRPLS